MSDVRDFWTEKEEEILRVIHWPAPLVKRMRANAVIAECVMYPYLYMKIAETWRVYENDCVDAEKFLNK